MFAVKKMTKFISLNIIAVFSICSCYSQENIPKKHSKIYLGIGSVFSSFQDTKFSNSRYSGNGEFYELGLENRKNDIWGLHFYYYNTNEQTNTHNKGLASINNYNFSIKYLKPLSSKKIECVYLGIKWDLIDIYSRSVAGLYNNSTYSMFASNLKVVGIYSKRLTTYFKLDTSVEMQLANFIYESSSFGFGIPQEKLVNGEFEYQVDDDDPLFESFENRLFWDYFNLSTNVKVHYKKRWTLSYMWNIQRSRVVKKYPLTRGYNSLSLIYNIKNK